MNALRGLTTWTPPTLRTVIESCAANVDEAERNEANARTRLDIYRTRLQRDSMNDTEAKALKETIGKTAESVKRYASEQPHWREYLSYYRDLLARFPDLADKPAEMAVSRDNAIVVKEWGIKPMLQKPHLSDREPLPPVASRPVEIAADEIPF